jgi:hypothetical protein
MRESYEKLGGIQGAKQRHGGSGGAGNPDWGRRCGGDDRADKWGPHGGDRGKGVAAGLRKLEEEAASGNYAKAAQAGMGRAPVHGPREERGCQGEWPG